MLPMQPSLDIDIFHTGFIPGGILAIGYAPARHLFTGLAASTSGLACMQGQVRAVDPRLLVAFAELPISSLRACTVISIPCLSWDIPAGSPRSHVPCEVHECNGGAEAAGAGQQEGGEQWTGEGRTIAGISGGGLLDDVALRQ